MPHMQFRKSHARAKDGLIATALNRIEQHGVSDRIRAQTNPVCKHFVGMVVNNDCQLPPLMMPVQFGFGFAKAACPLYNSTTMASGNVFLKRRNQIWLFSKINGY
jgi:hypothetical protein